MGVADGELTSMALCWRLERLDGAGLALTSHDQGLVRGSIAYDAAPGMMPASVKRSLGIDAAAGEVSGALSSAALSDADLGAGRWDGAAVQLSVTDWKDDEAEPVRLLGGELGAVALEDERFTADLLGAATRLDQPVCPATSPECRASFGDKRCRVDLAGRTLRGSVLSVDGSVLTLNVAVDERFVLGRLRYLSGAKCGLTTVMLSAEGSTVHIRDLPRASVEQGCVVELREGCDKRFDTCVSRFANAENFRGEPHLPGNDLLTRYPGA